MRIELTRPIKTDLIRSNPPPPSVFYSTLDFQEFPES
jgi:hypothetical protein